VPSGQTDSEGLLRGGIIPSRTLDVACNRWGRRPVIPPARGIDDQIVLRPREHSAHGGALVSFSTPNEMNCVKQRHSAAKIVAVRNRSLYCPLSALGRTLIGMK
jgi:hypothetical protein